MVRRRLLPDLNRAIAHTDDSDGGVCWLSINEFPHVIEITAEIRSERIVDRDLQFNRAPREGRYARNRHSVFALVDHDVPGTELGGGTFGILYGHYDARRSGGYRTRACSQCFDEQDRRGNYSWEGPIYLRIVIDVPPYIT
jgi:hypothetical protein